MCVCVQRAAANQRERNPTASGGELPVPGQYSLPQHQDRRRSRQQDFESQSSLRPPPKHSLESSRSSTKHEAEDVQGRHPADASVWSGDLDGVRKSGTPSEPLQPQLSSSHPEAELTGSNPRHRCTGTDGNPRHLHHVETNAVAFERPPNAHGRRATTQTTLLRRRRDGFSPPRRPNSPLQGYTEVFPETPANQPD
ncbi:hypothetical protein SprV_0501955800 [Sparganum proliferum]